MLLSSLASGRKLCEADRPQKSRPDIPLLGMIARANAANAPPASPSLPILAVDTEDTYAPAEIPLVKGSSVTRSNGMGKPSCPVDQGFHKAESGHAHTLRKRELDLLKKYKPDEYLAQFAHNSKFLATYQRVQTLEELDDYKGLNSRDVIAWWITVNPPFMHHKTKADLDGCVQVLQMSTEKFVKRKPFERFFYCFEQSHGTHPHVHLLVTRRDNNQGFKPSKRDDYLKKDFGHLFGDIKKDFENDALFHIRPCVLPAGKASIQSRIQYILGNKGKEHDHEGDLAFRKEFGFQEFYSNDSKWFTDVVGEQDRPPAEAPVTDGEPDEGTEEE